MTLETKGEEFVRGSVFAGRYEILEELGGGGMGKVFRVYDRKIEEEVALKLIRPEIAVDLNEEKGTHYITMEYVRGEDLRRLIRKMGVVGGDRVDANRRSPSSRGIRDVPNHQLPGHSGIP